MQATEGVSPDTAAIRADLEFFTRRWAELDEPVWLELRSFDSAGKPFIAKFRPDAEGLDLAAEWAADMNNLRHNVYAVRNPIKDTVKASASDADIAAAFFLWADADDGGATEKVARFQTAKACAIVKTGRVPATRAHFYWMLEDPCLNMEAWTQRQKAIAAHFGSDATVVNPSRIMRVSGTVAFPAPHKVARGYVPEVTAMRTEFEDDRDPIPFERALRVWPDVAPAPTVSGSGFIDTGPQPMDRERAKIAALSGEEWHNHVVRLVGSYVSKGLSDAEIHALTDPLTTAGYSVEDTRREVQVAIDGARRKGYAPEAQVIATAPPQTEPRPEGETSPLRPIIAAELQGLPIPPRLWHVDGLIPGRTVTMLGGDGGTGKSLLALQLAVATATGTPWIGKEVCPGPALFISAEDEMAELHRRLADICQAAQFPLSTLTHLHVASLAGEDALLAVLDKRSETLATTQLFAEVEELAEATMPSLIVLDTLADLFGGNENIRGQARQFIGMLRGLAMRHDCAVVLLAHPSLAGLNNGSGASGSTAWNGSVRSRLYFERIAEEGFEANPDARRLVTKKANYGRAGDEIVMHWREGVFVEDAPEPSSGLDKMAASAKAQRVFLKLLREIHDQGRHVSPAPSASYAPTVFARLPGAEGVSKRAFEAAMNALFSSGQICVGKHGRASKERSHITFGEGA